MDIFNNHDDYKLKAFPNSDLVMKKCFLLSTISFVNFLRLPRGKGKLIQP